MFLTQIFAIWEGGSIFLGKDNEYKDKWNYIKLKKLLYSEGNEQISFEQMNKGINKMKRQPSELETIFANYISSKVLIFKLNKESKQFNIKKPKQSNK